jgi:hypothetical protein
MSRTPNSKVEAVETTVPVARARPKRASVSVRSRISVPNQDPNYHYRVVNDLDDNISRLSERGYEIVPLAEVGAMGDKRVDNPSPLGSSSHFSVGQNVHGVVMRIQKDWYKEDQAIKQAEIDATEQTMKKDADYGQVRIAK